VVIRILLQRQERILVNSPRQNLPLDDRQQDIRRHGISGTDQLFHAARTAMSNDPDWRQIGRFGIDVLQHD